MTEIIKSFLKDGEHVQSGPIVGKFYKRTGSCNMCGKCCTDIHLVHGKEPIKTEVEFELLKPLFPDYRNFKPIGKSEDGLLFQCVHLQPDKSCAIYDERPLLCRRYPSEESLLMGGKLAKGCGYAFEVIRKFEQVLQETRQKKRLKAGKLIG